MTTTYQTNPIKTKAQAFAQARNLRRQGYTVKVYRWQGVYTQPGRGLVAYDYYEVRKFK